jgi:hypothetical protein
MFRKNTNVDPAAAAEAPLVKTTGVHHIFLLLVLVLTAIPAWKLYATLPRFNVMVEQVYPAEVRAGELVTLTGLALDPAHVEEVFLVSEGSVSYRTEIVNSTGNVLKFRVGRRTPAGWMSIAIKAPHRAELVDQMAYLRVLEPAG